MTRLPLTFDMFGQLIRKEANHHSECKQQPFLLSAQAIALGNFTALLCVTGLLVALALCLAWVCW